jgi:hypothetical protein
VEGAAGLDPGRVEDAVVMGARRTEGERQEEEH